MHTTCGGHGHCPIAPTTASALRYQPPPILACQPTGSPLAVNRNASPAVGSICGRNVGDCTTVPSSKTPSAIPESPSPSGSKPSSAVHIETGTAVCQRGSLRLQGGLGGPAWPMKTTWSTRPDIAASRMKTSFRETCLAGGRQYHCRYRVTPSERVMMTAPAKSAPVHISLPPALPHIPRAEVGAPPATDVRLRASESQAESCRS